MKISRSIGYALLAVGYIINHKEQDIVLSQNISKDYKIPLEYLLKIMQQLVRTNILRSKRGPRGGFMLARPSKKISMLEIIEAVEGPMVGRLNLVEHAPGLKYCTKTEKAYENALSNARSVFEKTKLSDLA